MFSSKRSKNIRPLRAEITITFQSPDLLVCRASDKSKLIYGNLPTEIQYLQKRGYEIASIDIRTNTEQRFQIGYIDRILFGPETYHYTVNLIDTGKKNK